MACKGQVIGVVSDSFEFFDFPADLYIPLGLDRARAQFPSFDGRGIARVKKGVSLAEANADAARMIPLLNEEFSSGGFENAEFGPRLRWLKDMVVGDLTGTLWLLMGTIGLLFLISCANVANLFLIRTQSRRAELALRSALGGGRAAIARVVFVESAILGLLGGVAGVLLAYLALPILLRIGARDLPHIMTVGIDLRVLTISLGATLAGTLAFGLFPALRFSSSRRSLTPALDDGGRSGGEGGRNHRFQNLLVAFQVALALVLLVGAGLMIRTFETLRQVDPGFQDPATVLTFQLTMPNEGDRESEPGRRRAMGVRRALLESIEGVGGVEAAGFSAFNDGLPLDGDGRSMGVLAESRADSDNAAVLRELQYASPGFLETLGTALLAGRMFEWSDIDVQRPVVLVSANLARSEWGSFEAALGKRIGTDSEGPWWEVVGVIADVHHNGLSQEAPEVVVIPAVPSSTLSVVVKSERVGDAAFFDEVRQAVWAVSPELSLANASTLDDYYRRALARTTMTLQLLATTGAMALFLGLVGVYGVIGYTVARRRHEIGIRLALGAARFEIRRMFVTRALVLVSIGAAVGLAAATGLTRLMVSQLYGVSPLDPLTLSTVAVGLVAAAGCASYLSVRRACALDPSEVLRGN